MGQLDGRVAIVTGSSRGVGYFMARELAREGCNIVVAARSERVTDPNLPGTIYSVAQELEQLGVQALPVRTDVTDEASIAACVAATQERFGRIDVLINNAGVMSPASVAETSLRRLDLIYRVNVRGPFAMTQAVLPTMLEQRTGTVITVSSVAADRSGAGNATYAMSKRAVEKFTEGLAEEVAEAGVRCFALKPEGLVYSPGALYQGLPSAHTDREEEWVMGRAAIWLIVSPIAARHTGEAFSSRAILRVYGDARPRDVSW
jgi:citronellol/citronellal dehydrogenase